MYQLFESLYCHLTSVLVPTRGLKRMRSKVDDDDDEIIDEDDDDENGDRNAGGENNGDDKWSKKLKRPRMTMVADEEESRYFLFVCLIVCFTSDYQTFCSIFKVNTCHWVHLVMTSIRPLLLAIYEVIPLHTRSIQRGSNPRRSDFRTEREYATLTFVISS